MQKARKHGRQRVLLALGTGLTFALAGCAAPDPIITVANLSPTLSADQACRPSSALQTLRVEGVGDFPASDSLVALLNLTGGDAPPGAETIDTFPSSTRAVRFNATGNGWRGEGMHLLAEAAELADVLLLPQGRPCALGDGDIRASAGTALAALPDGGLILAGGLDSSGMASRRLIRVPPDLAASEVIGEGLVSRRFSATATSSGQRVVIAGGGLGETGPAQDTFEVLDLNSNTLVAGRLCPTDGGSCTGRKDHGAAALRDGRILLVGGVSDDTSPPLASALLIDPIAGGADLDVAPLPFGRRNPQVLTLDNGETFVVGGSGMGGGFTGNVYWYDDSERTFVPTGPGDRPLPFVEGRAVALPGSRIAWVWEHNVVVLSFRDGPLAPTRIDLSFEDRLPSFGQLRAASFLDGTLLISGIEEAGTDSAFLVDPSDGTVSSIRSERARGELLTLSSGAVLAINDSGSSVYRGLLRTRFDNPPATLLPTDRDWLARDAFEGWEVDTEGARPNREASMVVPFADFTDLRMEVDADSGVDVLLTGSSGSATAIELRPGTAGLPLCTVAWTGGRVEVERRENNVTVRNVETGEERGCQARDLAQRVGVRLRFASSATVRAIRLERLP